MDSFVRHLLSRPPLDPEQERDLARRARAGDRGARDELLDASLRLVALRAVNLGMVGHALDEAVQSGTLGLIAAVDRFDPDRGCRLSTYAWPWITSAIRPRSRDEVSALSLDIAALEEPPVPHDDLEPVLAHLPRRLAAVVRLRYRLDEAAGPPRTRKEVAARLGLTVGQVRADEARALTQLRDRLAKVGHRAPRAGADPL